MTFIYVFESAGQECLVGTGRLSAIICELVSINLASEIRVNVPVLKAAMALQGRLHINSSAPNDAAFFKTGPHCEQDILDISGPRFLVESTQGILTQSIC